MTGQSMFVEFCACGHDTTLQS